MQQDENRFEQLDLMDGEKIEKSISARSLRGRNPGSSTDSLLLTNYRIIHVAGGGGYDVVMASVEDIDTVEFVEMTEGYGAFLWAGLSVVLSVALYGILENQIAQVIVPLMVLGMGIYLVVNRVFFSGGPAALFRTGGSAIAWSFRTSDESDDIREFINEMYRLKSLRNSEAPGSFAPR